MDQLLVRWCARFWVLAASLICISAQGALPSEDIFPATTKGYVSVPNLQELKNSWAETQLGKMVDDPAMQPFIEDLERQLRTRLNQAGVRLGLNWDDLAGVASGEVAVGTVQPKGDKTRAATILVADVAGNNQKALALLQKIGKELVAKGAQRSAQKVGGVEFSAFALAKKKPTDRPVTVFYGIHKDQLIATDDKETTQELIGRFQGEHSDSLRHLPAFEVTQKRSAEGLAKDAHLSWFVEPFGYVETVRAYAGGRKKRGSDMLKTLANQGFNCVRGIGGKVALATGSHEIHHQSFIYAPPVKRQPNDTNQSKYNLAARMLDFPNSDQLGVQDWVPKRLATYLTFRWKLKDAFWHSESLVNEIADAEVFREVLNDIEKDPNGPQINVEKEFVQHLGERVTVISDYREPITTKSERVLLAVEVTNPQSVMATLNKTMRSDRNAKEIKVDGHVIWEITQEEEFAVEEVKIDGIDFGPVAQAAADVEEEQPKEFRPNAAVTVAHGHFLIGTHVDYLAEILKQLDEKNRLAGTADFERVNEELKKLGSNEDSFRYFARTDQAYRVTYEMIRQNKMPEAETLLAKLLNGVFAPDDEESLREQQIDGRKLPEFEQIQKYLGPSGLYIRSNDEGWSVTGALLSKPAE